MRNFFQDTAAVYPFNECEPSKANAWSSPEDYILFGYHLTQRALRTYQDTLPLAVILAHEFGHQLQFTYNWMNSNSDSARNTELEADGWAGFYIALVKTWVSDSSRNAALQQIFDIGDYDFNSPRHHGTPSERSFMFIAGFQAAINYLDSLQRGIRPTFVDIHGWLEFYRVQSLGSDLHAKELEAAPEGVSRDVLPLLRAVARGEKSLMDFSFPDDWATTVAKHAHLFPTLAPAEKARPRQDGGQAALRDSLTASRR